MPFDPPAHPQERQANPVRTDLDPEDWAEFRVQAHRMLDDMIDHVRDVRQGPVWRPMPNEVRAALSEPVPWDGLPLREVHASFKECVLPYGNGNTHPRFMGWVHGGGNVFGMLGEMLAAGLNANLGGRSHAPIEVEREVVRWCAELFSFPPSATGVLVTGTSIANFMGVLAARTAAEGPGVKASGIGGVRLRAYASVAAHGCISRAMDMGGFGTEALRLVPVNRAGEMDCAALAQLVESDRAAGVRPFLVVGTAGTVGIGAIDPLEPIAELCKQHGLWFHVDGAFGALGIVSPTIRPRLAGIHLADSVAFDFHKWGQVPYDAGCLLVRDGAIQLQTFSSDEAYLRRATRGLAAGSPWPCDLGPDLSRGFRALKVWFTLKTLGLNRLANAIDQTCALARHLADRIDREPELERVAPVALNIVCFRYRFSEDADNRHVEVAADVQESGAAVPSTIMLQGRVVLRCAIVNHRTNAADIDAVVDAVLACSRRRAA